jgi:molecular chaperone GrpE
MTKKRDRKHPPDQADGADGADGERLPQGQGDQVAEGISTGPGPAETELTELEKLRAERDGLLARLQRVSADYLNYQKRVQRDIAEAREFANAELLKNLLGVLDDLERAIQAAQANHAADDPLLVGTQLVYDKALVMLERFGLSVIKAAGERFDPHKHHALRHEMSPDHPAGVVLAELQKGYELKGRTIRPAVVVVSMGTQTLSGPPPAGEQEG